MAKLIIPKTLDECTGVDSTAKMLSEWADRLRRIGGWLLAIIIIAGLFFSISASITEVTYGTYYTHTSTEFSFSVFLATIVTWIIYAFVEGCLYNVFALLLDAVASIVQNSKVSAVTALYNTKMIENEILSKNESKSTANDNSITEKIEKTSQPVTQAEAPKSDVQSTDPVIAIIQDGQKVCPKCGRKQEINRKCCWKCGQKFEN